MRSKEPALGSGGAAAGRRGRAAWLAWLGVLVLAGSLAWVGQRWLRREAPADPTSSPRLPVSPDPRHTYAGPFKNVRPEVKYIGDAACAGCHAVEADGFHRHPMGRSILPVAALAGKLHYEHEVHNPFTALGSRFLVERQADRLWHSEQRLDVDGKVLAQRRSAVDYVIGSGQRGHSFFSVQDGFLFQTSISWFSRDQIWDLSPGFHNGQPRPVLHECVFCHSGGALPVEHTENRYEGKVFTSPAIGCERCHGPGELHVKFRAADQLPKGRVDHTIVNPRHLEPARREAVCQQCHLEGEARFLRRGRGLFDFRPGLPLEDFWAVYLPSDEVQDKHKVVGHVEQMYESKCFQASKGAFGCATCHDPHQPVAPAERLPFYRTRCLNCHEQQHSCTGNRARRAERKDSCFECHMTRLHRTDIAHTATTDHRILRKPAAEAPYLPPPYLLPNPLVPFPRRPADDPDADRDLGIALVRAGQANNSFAPYRSRAEPLLERARARDPKDIPVLFHLALLLSQTDQPGKGIAVAEDLLALVPEHELTLHLAAVMAADAGKPGDALKYWEKLLAVSPRNADAHLARAALLAKDGRHERAIAGCRKLLALDPLRAEAWTVLAYCHEQRGAAARAAEARQMAEVLKTPESERFRAWFLGPVR